MTNSRAKGKRAERVVVVLPWPDTKKLHAHNTGHWRGKSPAVRDHRKAAAFVASESKRKGMPWRSATISYTFWMPNALKRDVGNLVQTCKPYVDGVVDAGLIEDDNWKVLAIGGVRCDIDRENPRVELELTHGKPVYPRGSE